MAIHKPNGPARRQSVSAKMKSALKANTVTNHSASMICTTESRSDAAAVTMLEAIRPAKSLAK